MEKDYLIEKWLNQGLTEDELKEFRQREDFEEIVAIVENARAFKASEFSEVGGYESFKTRLSHHTETTHRASWVKPLMRMAAVLVLGVALFYFLFPDNTVQIETQAAEKRTIELPDASTVTLNALSTLEYDKGSWDTNRLLQLEGEAFFEVTDGKRFEVNTAMGSVTVLGTEFNVNQRGSYFEVSCFEGKVQVVRDSDRNILMAGELLRYSNGQLELGSIKDDEPSWTRNLSSFHNVKLSEVLAELERQYGIEVSVGKVDTDTLFTGGFVHDDLENALKSITEPLELNFKLVNSKQVSLYPREN